MRPLGYRWPIDFHQEDEPNRYQVIYRMLTRHTGPRVRTVAQLRQALTKPDVFYLVPEEWRGRRPTAGNDADQVLGCGLVEGTEEEAAAPRPPQALPT